MKSDVEADVLHSESLMTAYIFQEIELRLTTIVLISLVEFTYRIFRLNPSIYPIQSQD